MTPLDILLAAISGDPAPRIRYYQLHQAFTHLPIAVLEVVIRDFEADA